MKIFKIVLVVVGIVALFLLGFLWYMGFFSTYKIEEREEGGYTVVGTEVIGPYSKAGQKR